MRRREFLPTLAAPLALGSLSLEAKAPAAAVTLKGRLQQGITRGIFGQGMSLETSCREAVQLGLQGFDLVGPADWPLLRSYGLTPSLYPAGPGGTITDGLNHAAHHLSLEKLLRVAIGEAASANVPNIIAFSGNRRGMDDRLGADNTVAFLNKVKAQAEDSGVTICLELLNSKVDHPDYMFDDMSWGVEVMKRVDSPNVKILYDIYHAQIMNGNIAQTIRENIQWIGHFHTGGNRSPELNHGFLMRVIAEAGYQGFVSHEFSPAQNHTQVIRDTVRLCDV